MYIPNPNKMCCRKFKFVITFNERSRPSELLLRDYYEDSHSPETQNTETQAGMWVLLKKVILAEGDLD